MHTTDVCAFCDCICKEIESLQITDADFWSIHGTNTYDDICSSCYFSSFLSPPPDHWMQIAINRLCQSH